MKRSDVAGSLCLDFVNTVDPRHATSREEHLPDYPALLDWARHAGVVTPAEASRLAPVGARRGRQSGLARAAARPERMRLT